jgi:rhodanese-related sulfurtransferase
VKTSHKLLLKHGFVSMYNLAGGIKTAQAENLPIEK